MIISDWTQWANANESKITFYDLWCQKEYSEVFDKIKKISPMNNVSETRFKQMKAFLTFCKFELNWNNIYNFGNKM